MGKIPDHATCVFKGKIFDVYQWEQELYDGSKATFEMLKRGNTVVVIPLQGDQVTYTLQEQPGKAPYLALPGGRAEEGEEPLETAKRELLEETGMISDEWQLIRTCPSPGKIDWTVYFFVARDCRKVARQMLDAGEKVELLTASVDYIVDTIFTDPRFREYELQSEIMSAFDPAKANALKAEIRGEN